MVPNLATMNIILHAHMDIKQQEPSQHFDYSFVELEKHFAHRELSIQNEATI